VIYAFLVDTVVFDSSFSTFQIIGLVTVLSFNMMTVAYKLCLERRMAAQKNLEIENEEVQLMQK
jgi:hypothetical protein